MVIRASSIPNLSLRTFARGARQLVVHEALETGVYMGGDVETEVKPKDRRQRGKVNGYNASAVTILNLIEELAEILDSEYFGAIKTL